jgi:hypothetical protein
MDMGIANSSLAYTDGMKMILALLVSIMFVACSSPDTENLKKENSDLKTQLETVTKERDALKVQLDGIKAVLENAAGSTSITTAPDSSATPVTPDSGSTPDSSMDSGNSSADSSTPSTAAPAPNNTPSSDGSGATTPDSSNIPNTPDSSSGATTKPSSAIEMYAKEVLETAQKYNAETQQTPPTECSNGYTAGTHAVPSSDAVQSCRVDRVDNGFRVTLKDANGAITMLPTP